MPTKYEIRQYLTDFIENLEGFGLIITDYHAFEAEMDRITETDYLVLRDLLDENDTVSNG